MSKKQIAVAGLVGAGFGTAVMIHAGSDSNGDGVLEFVDGEIITADDINTNFTRAAEHIVRVEGALTITDEGSVGLLGEPIDDESLFIFQDEAGVGDHLNLRLQKADGGDLLQLEDGTDYQLTGPPAEAAQLDQLLSPLTSGG